MAILVKNANTQITVSE